MRADGAYVLKNAALLLEAIVRLLLTAGTSLSLSSRCRVVRLLLTAPFLPRSVVPAPHSAMCRLRRRTADGLARVHAASSARKCECLPHLPDAFFSYPLCLVLVDHINIGMRCRPQCAWLRFLAPLPALPPLPPFANIASIGIPYI